MEVPNEAHFLPVVVAALPHGASGGGTVNPHISSYLSTLGRKGGQATGPTKRRGDAEHYRALAAKAVAARLAKAQAKGGVK